jgi:hypothetical protein
MVLRVEGCTSPINAVGNLGFVIIEKPRAVNEAFSDALNSNGFF